MREDGPVTERRPRADRLRTRAHLLDVMGRMLEAQGPDFSLPDLARESGVAIATVYRHFADLGDLREEFYNRYVGGLVDDLAQLVAQYRGRQLVHEICRAWVESAMRWARAATFIRSPDGYLERLHADDVFIRRLHGDVLEPAVRGLIDDGEIREQDVEYAALLWITLFDERVLIDLTQALGWSVSRASGALEASLMGALSATPAPAN